MFLIDLIYWYLGIILIYDEIIMKNAISEAMKELQRSDDATKKRLLREILGKLNYYKVHPELAQYEKAQFDAIIEDLEKLCVRSTPTQGGDEPVTP